MFESHSFSENMFKHHDLRWGDKFKMYHQKETFSPTTHLICICSLSSFQFQGFKERGTMSTCQRLQSWHAWVICEAEKHKIKDSIAQTVFLLLKMTMRYFITGLKIHQEAALLHAWTITKLTRSRSWPSKKSNFNKSRIKFSQQIKDSCSWGFAHAAEMLECFCCI